jgi:hypothetical protein
MFEDWKQAWREAVDNFRRELSDDDTPSSERTRSMHRQVVNTRNARDKLDHEIRRTHKEAEEERNQESICRRREQMARSIKDDETVRLAVEFAVRHAERAVILERKVEVLEAERGLLVRDLEQMEKHLAEQPDAPRMSTAQTLQDVLADRERERQDRDFGKLEREQRERDADAKLEEIKRRMK